MEHLMEHHCACSQRRWIIEYAWAHNILDVFKDVEASFWSDGDWEPLSLDEPWHVRVVSAQVFSIVRNRQIRHYERVLNFLENIHTLMPTLVPAIKHMKITYGLKTMVIMWMLREGAGPVDIVQKINKYFPRKLRQYQERCRKHEAFVMIRNQLEFRAFAQLLIMDKQKLEDYIQNHIEEQYGEHYAQKTEERLLIYLQEVDKVLPKETYIDKIMRKSSPVKEEEKAMLDLISDDAKTLTTTLKTLLCCDAGTCFSLKSELRTRTLNYKAPEAHVCKGASTDGTAARKFTDGHVGSPVTDTIIDDGDGVRSARAVAALTDGSTKTTCGAAVKEASCPKSSAHVVKVPPHFCSKHQRWVRNILCECPGESSEEQAAQDSEISPSLFTTSSSSSDLTPSNITIPPDHHPSPCALNQIREAKEPELVEKPVSEAVYRYLDPPSQLVPTAVQSVIPGGTVKVLTVPCEAVTSVSVCLLQTSTTSNYFSNDNNKDSKSSTSSFTDKNPMPQTAASPTPLISKLSRKFTRGQKYSQSQKNDHEEDGSKNVEYSPQAGFVIFNAATSVTTDIASKTHAHLETRANPADHITGPPPGSSTFVSGRMQPRVVLKRMSKEECLKATKRRLLSRQCEDTEEHGEDTEERSEDMEENSEDMEEHSEDTEEHSEDTEEHSEDADSSLDVNSLYSSCSLSEEEEDEEDSDTEYQPHRNTLRRWFLGY